MINKIHTLHSSFVLPWLHTLGPTLDPTVFGQCVVQKNCFWANIGFNVFVVRANVGQ